MSTKGRRIVAGVVAVALLVGLVVFTSYYVDWLWFGEVQLRVVFWRAIRAQLVVGPVLGSVFFAVIYATIATARRLSLRRRDPVARTLQRAGLALSLVTATIIAFVTAQSWMTFLGALYGGAFGRTDPVFHRDIGFYVFTLPALEYLDSFLFATLIAALCAAIAVHVLLGSVKVEPAAGIAVGDGALSQVSVLLAVLFILTGFGEFLNAWGLLFSANGVVSGAGYTDVHVRLPALRVLSVVAWLIAAALLANVRRQRRFMPLYALGGWIVALIVLSGVVPGAVQSLVVNPNQGAEEAEYIVRNIEATRAAYNLEGIASTKLLLTGALTSKKLVDNDPTIRNIRLWDPETLLDSYRQLQELRPYYVFKDVDVDRYQVNGVYRETMLSARQMNIAGLPAQAQTWVNQHITYTHGYGIAVSAVNQVTSDGSPDFLVQDVPLTSTAPSLAVTEPRIYYGELGTEYTLVKTKAPEFDYPGPNGDVYRSYDGSGGIAIGSFVNKLAFAFEFGTIKFFTSSAIDADTRVIIKNDIGQRLRSAAPFLEFDADPYMVVANGRLYWIADAYTTTDRFPYSAPMRGVTYVRNSVKAVIDVYNGSLDFYAFEPTDPLLVTYSKMFPGMFKPKSAMPAALLDHVRYPEDYFNLQAEVFASYHVTSPSVFYNKGDQWEIPSHVSISGAGRMEAYYVIMRLPSEAREEFALILPFAPNGRNNMIGWLGAESDGARYGKAVAFDFPSSQTVYGPAQVEAAVNQDPVISSQRTLWGQQGSRVIFGNLLVVPVEDSLLYVQPMYIESEQTKLPQFKRVVVFYKAPAGSPLPPSGEQQNVVMAPSLGEALERIFGMKGIPAPAPPAPPPPPAASASAPAPAPAGEVPSKTKSLIDQANQQFVDAESALKAGDFAGYGRHVKELETTLRQLQTLR